MKHNRLISLCLVIVLAFGMVPFASAADPHQKASDFSDFEKDAWYAEAVAAAVDNQLLHGTDKGLLNPQGNLTRAEMAAITNRAFGTYVRGNICKFKDVSKNAWYYKDIQMAYFMGTYQGTGTETMSPDQPISRQEVMTVVARALQLNLDCYQDTSLSKFGDSSEVSSWALPYVKAMVGAGYIQGRNTGLDPLDNITRAEFCQIFHNIIKEYILKGGSYTEDRTGNLLIRTDNVELHDMTIDGDLILGNGVANGKITLDNVTVTGRVVVWGGGTEAVYMNNGTTLPELVVCRVDDPVKVIFDKDSTLAVHDKIKVNITKRADAFKETEVIFYNVDGILDAQEDLNGMVDDNQISVTIPAHLNAEEGNKKVVVHFENNSERDTYHIALTLDDNNTPLSDPLELSAGEICSVIELKEDLPLGDYPCTATVTAMRDGKTIGTLAVSMTLHIAHMWSTGG